jgi:two-component system, chemotaxis family, CheB/CheR fusion protein
LYVLEKPMAKRPTSRSTRRTKKTSGPGIAKAKTRKATAAQSGTRGIQEQPGEHLVPVVGVGASAGGLEAFTHLLQALPADTGMAFVLISHLSHTHKSMLTELLSKSTRMKVVEVSRKTRVQANHVYVITPDADLALSDGAITVRSAVESRKPHMAIDHFFRSLAQHRKSQAIGVVLSGTGTDGTLGLAAIRAEGGRSSGSCARPPASIFLSTNRRP